MGATFEINSIEEMCDLMCDNRVPDNDSISRKAIIDEIWKLRRSQQMLDDTQRADLVMHGMYLVEKAVEKLPSVQPRKGKWILDEDPHDGDCRCSACLMAIDQLHERNHGLLNALTGGKWWTFYNFCPNCGSYNGGEQDE